MAVVDEVCLFLTRPGHLRSLPFLQKPTEPGFKLSLISKLYGRLVLISIEIISNFFHRYRFMNFLSVNEPEIH